MIFPWFKDAFIPRFTRAPVTWILLYMMLLTYFMTGPQNILMEHHLGKIFSDKVFVHTQGHLYSRYIDRNPAGVSPLIQQKAKKALRGDQQSLKVMGYMALRDPKFYFFYQGKYAGGDEVAKKVWQQRIADVREFIDMHPTYQLGYFSFSTDWTKMITYQFVHGGLLHLLGNALFLLIVGSYLEPLIGGAAFLLVFLITGFFGAIFYALLGGGLSLAPMIGSSGSVSGLIGFFGALYWRRPIRFMYFTWFEPGFYGWIYLPTWIFLIHRAILDFAGYLASNVAIGGAIAFPAHLGGLGVGLLLGYVLFGWSKATA